MSVLGTTKLIPLAISVLTLGNKDKVKLKFSLHKK